MDVLKFIGIRVPLIERPVNLSRVIVENAIRQGVEIEDGDVIVVTSKVLLKSLGLLIDTRSVRPSFRARIISKLTGKDPIETEIVLRHSKKVLFIVSTSFLSRFVERISRNVKDGFEALSKVRAIMFVETNSGLIASDAGLDYSNIPPGYAIVNDYDFDRFARQLRDEIKELTGKNIAVLIADTEFTFSNGKFGSLDLAVGSAGIDPIAREFGEKDLYGRSKFGGLDIIVDEICAGAALLMRQAGEGIPTVLVKGLKYRRSNSGIRDILISKHRKKARKVILLSVLKNIVLKMLMIT